MHFEAAMAMLKIGGRVAVCGTISNYNDAAPTVGPPRYRWHLGCILL